jgi:hypothetical protein
MTGVIGGCMNANNYSNSSIPSKLMDEFDCSFESQSFKYGLECFNVPCLDAATDVFGTTQDYFFLCAVDSQGNLDWAGTPL